MSKRVKVDGRIFVVPDDATPDEIDQISRASSPAPQVGTTPESMGIKNPIPQAVPPALQKPMASAQPPAPRSSIVDAGIGALKGAANTMFNSGTAGPTGSYASAINLSRPDAGVNTTMAAAAPPSMAPSSTAQKVGYGVEQAGEWLIPSGAEEKAANLFSGKVGPLAAKVGASALESGARNMSQGGDFKTGAIAGAAGAAASPVLKSAANTVADIAMRPGVRLMKSLPEGVQKIGQTVLENSTADKPELIASQLGDKIGAAAKNKNVLLDTAKQQGVTGSLAPARNLYESELKSAVKQNAPGYIKDVNSVGDQLKYQFGEDGKPVMAAANPPTRPGAGFIPTVQVPTGAAMQPKALPANVDPVSLQAIKEGIGKTVGNFNPEAQAAIDPLKERVYGALTGEIHNAVPGTGALDQQMTNLFPAQQAAHNVAFHPDLAHSVANRVARATGALAASTGGAYAGYKEGGVPGAVGGGLFGLVAPEAISSPTGQMFMARRFASPNSVNLFKGAALQFNRPSVNKK